MAWACDYCRSPALGGTGGHGNPEACSNPSCYVYGKSFPDRPASEGYVSVLIAVNPQFIRDANEDTAVLMLGRDAYRAAVRAIEEASA